jgi:hypothetical protein
METSGSTGRCTPPSALPRIDGAVSGPNNSQIRLSIAAVSAIPEAVSGTN